MAPPDDKDREDLENEDEDAKSPAKADAESADSDESSGSEDKAEAEAEADADADADAESDEDYREEDHEEDERDAERDRDSEVKSVTRAKAAPPTTEDDDPGIIAMLKKIDRGIGMAELGVLVGLIVLLILIGSYNAFRDLAGKQTSLAIAEMFRYSVFAIAMVGAGLAAQRSAMISMDIVGRLAKPKTRTIIRIITNLFAAFMTLLLLMRSYAVTKVVKDDVPFDHIPPSKGVWILPIGLALILFHMVVHAVIDTIYVASDRLPPETGGEDIQVH